MWPAAPQQASISTRLKVWLDAIPLCARSILGLSAGVYIVCLLAGYDNFFPVCLSARELVEKAQLYRIATAPLLHVGSLHLAFNMMAFVPIASSLERAHGTLFLVHLLALLATVCDIVFVILSYLLALWDAKWLHTCAVGFSGIIFGLIVIDNASSGASHRSVFGLFSVPAKAYPWTLLVLWQILLPGVSFLGHLGGVAAGEAQARGWLFWAMPSSSVFQRLEGLWPVRLCTGINAFILSSSAPLSGPTLPTSYRASDADGGMGAPDSSRAGAAFSVVARLRDWLSGGWTRLPTSEPEQHGAVAPPRNPVTRFPGQGHTTGAAGSGTAHDLPHAAAHAAAQARATSFSNTSKAADTNSGQQQSGQSKIAIGLSNK